MPVAITTGGKDTVVPPQSALRLAEKIRRNHARVLVLDRPEQGHRTDYADTKAAVEFVLRHAIGP
jgi:predicted esterase